jgi:hypothetical protein
MRLRIIFLSICLGLFLISVSAQDNPFPNEIEGLQFTKQATFRSLKFLISTKDDIASVFGRNCVHTCRYDDNWDIEFSYVTKDEKDVAAKYGVKLTYKVRREFIGKVKDIDLLPRKPHILSESLVFPKGLYCRIPTEYPNPEKIKVCWDGSVTACRMYSENDPAGRHKKNEVIVITYTISNENRKNMFETGPEPAGPKN